MPPKFSIIDELSFGEPSSTKHTYSSTRLFGRRWIFFGLPKGWHNASIARRSSSTFAAPASFSKCPLFTVRSYQLHFAHIAPPPRQGCATPGFGPPLTRLRGINRTGHHAIVTPQKSAPPYLCGFRPPFTTASPSGDAGDAPHDEFLLKSLTDCSASPTAFCTFPEICFESPLTCCSLLPTSLPVFSWTLPTTSFATPFTWSLFMFDCSCCKRYTQRDGK